MGEKVEIFPGSWSFHRPGTLNLGKDPWPRSADVAHSDRATDPLKGRQVWLVGRRWPRGFTETEWEVRGLEATENEAVARCKPGENDFIAPLIIGAEIPDKVVAFPGAYYPEVIDG